MNINDEAIEAAAEALYKFHEWSIDTNGVYYENNTPWDSIGEGAQDQYRDMARAVVPAIRAALAQESSFNDVPTFNQCEVHGKCVNEDWVDDKGKSHAECLTPVPEHVKHRLKLLSKIQRQRKALKSALAQRDKAEAERDALLAARIVRGGTP